ncbi:MAG: signal recognition particle-docking protein FtsY [Candidatus Krumholzibacteria bacterium]|nr:signal recognition particle-docking protein FtsY [Candidatus Krumholzibacteria bacterium]
MQKLFQGLRKTKECLFGSLQGIFSGEALDADALEELEGVLLSADLGPEATERIIERLRKQAPAAAGPGEYRRIMAEELLSIIKETPAPEPPKGSPRVIVVVGVNGVGKTSTIGKLAYILKKEGHSVVLAACDTFRAAAVEQLELWAERAGVPIVRQRSGADPAAVAFDAVQSARAKNADVVIVDTAGRLHTKVNLMDELKKIFNVLSTRMEGVGLESWLVLDANTGQNSLRQAEAFTAALPVSGIVLTKLDSTAKGGAIVTIQRNLRVPVIYVGVGEGLADLERFDPELFVSAMLGE